MIGGSQGHRPFRPHGSKPRGRGFQRPLFPKMQENRELRVGIKGRNAPSVQSDILFILNDKKNPIWKRTNVQILRGLADKVSPLKLIVFSF